MTTENMLAFPQTAETIARHAEHNYDDAVAFIAKKQGATIYQVQGDIDDGHYSKVQVVSIAQKLETLGIEVRQWNTYSFYDYNPLKDLERVVTQTERARANRPVEGRSVKQHSVTTLH